MVAHAARELRMAELVDELPRGILEARDVVDEVARICLEQPGKKPETLSYEQWFYQLIRQELDRQCRLFAEERHRRVELAHQEKASDDESEGYDAERPLGLITSEIEPEESRAGAPYPRSCRFATGRSNFRPGTRGDSSAGNQALAC